jgi:excisionase family DNA binding protein
LKLLVRASIFTRLTICAPLADTGGMKILTTEEAGQRLGIGKQRVRDLIESGRLPAKKFGRTWMIEEQDLKRVAVRKPGRPKKRKGE